MFKENGNQWITNVILKCLAACTNYLYVGIIIKYFTEYQTIFTFDIILR